VLSSKCRFFGARWRLRMTLLGAFFRNLFSPERAVPLGRERLYGKRIFQTLRLEA
jgi:hypothetical protein